MSVALLAGVLCLAPARSAHAQQPSVADSVKADTSEDESPDIISPRMRLMLGGAALATAVIVPFDRPIQSAFQSRAVQAGAALHGAADALAYAGAQGPFLAGGVLFVTGRLGRAERVADLGLHLAEAAALAAGIGGIGKGIAGRALPDVPSSSPGDFAFGRGFRAENGPYVSFPAGHAAVAFASAAVLTSEAARWRPELERTVGIAAYGSATLVALARVYQNRHWASDNPIAAVIGTWSGLTIVNLQHHGARSRLDRWLLGVSAVPTMDGTVVVGWSSRSAEGR